MGRAELEGEHGAAMRSMNEASNAQQVGTAAAAEFLLSPTASYISGADLLVDGGVVAAVTNHVG